MNRKALILIALLFSSIGMQAFKKKTTGICYCKYLSGDKKELDPRDSPVHNK